MQETLKYALKSQWPLSDADVCNLCVHLFLYSATALITAETQYSLDKTIVITSLLCGLPL